MNIKSILILNFIGCLLFSCSSDRKKTSKGFQTSEIVETQDGKKIVGLPIDSLNFETRPYNVLQTKLAQHKLSPIYKVNYKLNEYKFRDDKDTLYSFTGSNSFHTTWDSDVTDSNNWNGNYMPGLAAVSGYNLVNVSHFNIETKVQNEFFKKPVLIKTLYYPAFSQDTLDFKPISRNYHMVSAYDEDTNKDGYINMNDLRRFYLFDINGKLTKELVPKNYSVISSDYDVQSDYMYVFAKLDQNKNGQIEDEEAQHIFWINLKEPEKNGYHYKN